MNILMLLTPKNEVVFIKESFSVRQALEKIERHRYSSVPIINDAGGYVGTITEGDLLWGIKNNISFSDMDELEHHNIMEIPRHSDNKPIRIAQKVEDLYDTAMTQNFVPVIDDSDTFIGIVTRRNIMQYIKEKKDEKV